MGTVNTTTRKPGYTDFYQGMKNVCDKPVVIKGIKKLQSKLGTDYYQDASFELNPGQMTDFVIEVENSYNPKTAAVGSIHYYKNKLVIK